MVCIFPGIAIILMSKKIDWAEKSPRSTADPLSPFTSTSLLSILGSAPLARVLIELLLDSINASITFLSSASVRARFITIDETTSCSALSPELKYVPCRSEESISQSFGNVTDKSPLEKAAAQIEEVTRVALEAMLLP
jgi:hypothetical protein